MFSDSPSSSNLLAVSSELLPVVLSEVLVLRRPSGCCEEDKGGDATLFSLDTDFLDSQEKGLVSVLVVGGGGAATEDFSGGAVGGGGNCTRGRVPERPCCIETDGSLVFLGGGFSGDVGTDVSVHVRECVGLLSVSAIRQSELSHRQSCC